MGFRELDILGEWYMKGLERRFEEEYFGDVDQNVQILMVLELFFRWELWFEGFGNGRELFNRFFSRWDTC